MDIFSLRNRFNQGIFWGRIWPGLCIFIHIHLSDQFLSLSCLDIISISNGISEWQQWISFSTLCLSLSVRLSLSLCFSLFCRKHYICFTLSQQVLIRCIYSSESVSLGLKCKKTEMSWGLFFLLSNHGWMAIFLQEKTGPKLESETLCLRGDESKFINALEQKVFMTTFQQE